MDDADAEAARGVPALGRRHALTALRHRDFRLLCSSQVVAITGHQMQAVTVAWHVYLLTDSPLSVGLLGLFRVVPLIGLSLAGGAAADLVDRKRILVVTQLLAVVLSGVLAVTTVMGWVTLGMIYAVVLLSEAGRAFEHPARLALIPNLVPKHDLANALTLQTLVRHLGTIVGPAVGGVVIGQFGLAPTYGLSALSPLAVVGALLVMGPVPQARGAGAPTWGTVLGGLRYIGHEPLLLSLLALDFFVILLSSMSTLLPIFARDVLAVGPQGLGLLHAAPALGALGGGTLLGMLGPPPRPIPLILACSVAYGLFVLGFGLAGAFPVALLMLFGTGATEVVAAVLRHTVVQLRVPDELRGRVGAVSYMFALGGPYLGQMESGVVASLVGPVAAAIIGGSGAVLVAAGFSLVPAMRRSASQPLFQLASPAHHAPPDGPGH